MNFIGSKFQSLADERFNLSVICARLRSNFKCLFNKPWKFSISKNNYRSITIKILQAPMELVIDKSARCMDDLFDIELCNKLYNIANEYNYDNSDPITDYFDRNYYVHFDISKIKFIG